MKKITLVAPVALALSSCNSDPKFNVKGDASETDGKVFYLEASGLEGIVLLDSVKLKRDDSFGFKQLRPESPELYRLRVGNKVINSLVDSAETVSIEAPYTDFSTTYIVEGPDNSARIKKLTLRQIRLQKNVDALVKAVQANQLGNGIFENGLTVLLRNYKDGVKINYIFAAPNTASAYFVSFQKLNNYMIFDPLNNRDNIKCFGAVTTNLNNTYSHVIRSKSLYNIVIKGMKNTRTPQQRTIEVPEERIAETDVIDIALRDMKGNIRKPTNLKGEIVLLDFTVYQSAVSAPHSLVLRDLYNKHAGQGLGVYQVSLDTDEHFWKTSADNLPWVYVRDENGIYSTNAALYGVKDLPALFLISRNNELRTCEETIKDLGGTIKSMLWVVTD